MNNFTKRDLKANMIVELRNKSLCMIHEVETELVLISKKDWLRLDDYREDLSFSDKEVGLLDIVKVYNPNEAYQLINDYWYDAPIIWERKELSRLTGVEKVILENAIFNDERFGWISRDKNGIIHLYINRPEKDEEEDVWISDTYISLNIYSHLFQFIKWTDAEAYSIHDLIEPKQNEG